MVYPEDQPYFLHTFSKKHLFEELKRSGTFTLDYRLVIDGKPRYYNLKTSMDFNTSEGSYIVIGVRNVDEQTRRQKAAEAEKEVYSQIALALANRYEAIYYVNSDTFEYKEYCSSEKYAQIEKGMHGKDFFADVQRNMPDLIYSEDYSMMQQAMEKENFLRELQRHEVNSLVYRLMIDGKPQYTNLRAMYAMNDPHHIIVAIANIDASKRREIEFREALGTAVIQATRDALTGVKNKYAYVHAEEELNARIGAGRSSPFSVAVFDINDLKIINDTQGHSAGDAYIRSACRMICTVFKHSPVYRIGGDEFAAILRGEDYENAEVLLSVLRSNVLANQACGLVTVASGISKFIPGKDAHVEDVFTRADAEMYENKKKMKKMQQK